MTIYLEWPGCLLRPTTVKVTATGPTRSAGQTLSGGEQVVQSPAARWSLTLTDVPVRTREQTLTWRALETLLQGRAGKILVPVYDWSRSPAGRKPRVTFSDGSTFSDGTRMTSPACVVEIAADAALQATSIAVAFAGSAPQPGQFFSIAERLYRIAQLAPGAPDRDGRQTATLTIRPWLRAAVAAGTRLEFDEPAGVFRLASDDALDLDLELWRFGHPNVSFNEAF